MRAIIIQQFGGLDSLVIENLPDPVPQPGSVLIKVKAFGINHAETHMRKGEWAEAATVSGIECVGLVKSCPLSSALRTSQFRTFLCKPSWIKRPLESTKQSRLASFNSRKFARRTRQWILTNPMAKWWFAFNCRTSRWANRRLGIERSEEKICDLWGLVHRLITGELCCYSLGEPSPSPAICGAPYATEHS
jgi:hypothetical protein